MPLHGQELRVHLNFPGPAWGALAWPIIVSPQCDWDWKSCPKPWVNELVAALRAASFVDRLWHSQRRR